MKSLSRKSLVIGVSGQSPHTRSVRTMMRQIREEGGRPLFLLSPVRCQPTEIERAAGRIDALVLMGNTLDIDPKSYIHRYPPGDSRRGVHPHTKSELSTPRGRARARYEEKLLSCALAQGIPVLGICGGMQRINVVCGGTLHQHLPDLVGCDKHMQNRRGIALHIPVVPVIIREETLLAGIAGGIRMPFVKSDTGCPKVIMENSLHHQAVDQVAPGLRVSAMTDSVRRRDGTYGYLTEAVEADPGGPYGKQFILGVQWHPEFGASTLGERIVRQLLAAARDFSQQRRRRPIMLVFRAVHRVSISER
ncbi:MAG: gamma-glutamyl-gamma-aminobutyrate hydrolase family protein [Pseudomonadota bacterium]|nr:gamma-glutamyl-gamma-aminobutyrate hydrolase family protein [Pseudomonadota bacterium]